MTIVNFILDESGSMDTIQKDTIGAFNNYIRELQKSKEKIIFNLTTFDHQYRRIIKNTNVKEVKPLTEKTYHPTGMTALFDAVVEASEQLEKEIPDLIKEMKKKPAVLTVVLTDGEENSSRKHDQECYQKLVKDLEKDDWTFVYLGANQDSWGNAARYGITRGNSGDWDASSRGVYTVMDSLVKNTVAYAANASAGGGGNVSNFNSLAEDLKKNGS